MCDTQDQPYNVAVCVTDCEHDSILGSHFLLEDAEGLQV